MTSGIYLLTFKNPNRFYIGKSKNIEKRYLEHCRKLKQGSHYLKLQNKFNLSDLSTLKILRKCHEDFSTALETAYINLYVHSKGINRVLNTHYSKLDLSLVKKYCFKLHTQIDITLPLIETISLILPSDNILSAETLYDTKTSCADFKNVKLTEPIHDI